MLVDKMSEQSSSESCSSSSMLTSGSTETSSSRSTKRSSSDLEDNSPSPKRRLVTARTVDKWIVENDKSLNKSTWPGRSY